MLRRLLIGLLKGIAIGGAIGAALHFGLQWTAITSGLNYVLYGVVALLAGVLAGQPPWRQGAWVGSILKGVVGFGLGALLYFLGNRFLGGVHLAVPGGAAAALPHSTLLFAPIVATIVATLFELDDGGEQPVEDKSKTGVRVKPADTDAFLASLPDEDEVEAQKPARGKAKR